MYKNSLLITLIFSLLTTIGFISAGRTIVEIITGK